MMLGKTSLAETRARIAKENEAAKIKKMNRLLPLPKTSSTISSSTHPSSDTEESLFAPKRGRFGPAKK